MGSARIYGERRFSMRVWLSAAELAARGLTVQDVQQAIRTRNVEVPAGRIESERREFTVRSLGELKTPAEFSELVVSSQGGQLVKLQDLGRVELGPQDERSELRFNGTPSVAIGVIRQSKANIIDVADAIRAELPKIQQVLPPGVKLDVAFDQSTFVKRSIKEAEETLVLAAGLVVVIIFLFLRNLPRHDHPRPRDPGVDRLDVRDHVLPRLLDQQLHAARADARHRHRGGRRDHRAGERLPASGRVEGRPRYRGPARHGRDRLRGDRDDHLAGGRVHAACLPAGLDRPPLQRIRHRRGRVGGPVRTRGAHAHAHAVRQDPAGARRVTDGSTSCSRPASTAWPSGTAARWWWPCAGAG